MKSSYTPLAVLALVAGVSAQSAPGFPVQVSNELAVDFQSAADSFLQPGEMLPLKGKNNEAIPLYTLSQLTLMLSLQRSKTRRLHQAHPIRPEL